MWAMTWWGQSQKPSTFSLWRGFGGNAGRFSTTRLPTLPLRAPEKPRVVLNNVPSCPLTWNLTKGSWKTSFLFRDIPAAFHANGQRGFRFGGPENKRPVAHPNAQSNPERRLLEPSLPQLQPWENIILRDAKVHQGHVSRYEKSIQNHLYSADVEDHLVKQAVLVYILRPLFFRSFIAAGSSCKDCWGSKRAQNIKFGTFCQGLLGLENFLPTSELVFRIKPQKSESLLAGPRRVRRRVKFGASDFSLQIRGPHPPPPQPSPPPRRSSRGT